MKFLNLLTFIFVVSYVFQGHAKTNPLSEAKESSYQQSIQQGCINDYKGPSGDKNKVCKCVARNYIVLSRGWAEKSQREAILKNLSDFYNNRLSEKEISADPYFLTDYIIGISDDCLKNSNYKLKPSP